MEIFHICISVLLCVCDNIFLPSNYVLSVEFVTGLIVILPDMTPTDISNLLRISNKKLKSSTNPPCCANSVFWNHTNMSYCSLLKDWRWQSDSNSKIYLSAVYISFRFLSCLLATQKKKNTYSYQSLQHVAPCCRLLLIFSDNPEPILWQEFRMLIYNLYNLCEIQSLYMIFGGLIFVQCLIKCLGSKKIRQHYKTILSEFCQYGF